MIGAEVVQMGYQSMENIDKIYKLPPIYAADSIDYIYGVDHTF